MNCPKCGNEPYHELSGSIRGIRHCRSCGYTTSRLHEEYAEQFITNLSYLPVELLERIAWQVETEIFAKRTCEIASFPQTRMLNIPGVLAIGSKRTIIVYEPNSFHTIPMGARYFLNLIRMYELTPLEEEWFTLIAQPIIDPAYGERTVVIRPKGSYIAPGTDHIVLPAETLISQLEIAQASC